MTETLKYPAGEWTHAEFAETNGKTKPSVYNQLQDALKNGTVVVCGSRSSGKGKPSKLYKVADSNTPVVIPAKVEVKPEPQPEVKSEIKSEVLPEPVTESVVVAEVTAPVKSEETDVPVTVAPEKHLTDRACPICQSKVHAWRTGTGVMVMCQQPIEVCSSTENPYGHGRSEKDAYEVMVAKWTFGKGRSN